MISDWNSLIDWGPPPLIQTIRDLTHLIRAPEGSNQSARRTGTRGQPGIVELQAPG